MVGGGQDPEKAKETRQGEPPAQTTERVVDGVKGPGKVNLTIGVPGKSIPETILLSEEQPGQVVRLAVIIGRWQKERDQQPVGDKDQDCDGQGCRVTAHVWESPWHHLSSR